MNNQPQISVLLAVHNGLPHLAAAVDSVLSQAGVSLELVVVDDGSTDGSAEYVRGLADPRIRLIRLGSNQGLPVALNAGLDQATGEFIARQDADDLSLPRRLDRQLKLARRSEAVLIGGHWEVMTEAGLVYDRFGPPDEPVAARERLIRQGGLFPHGAALIRAESLRRLGGYNEAFTYTQDLELFGRLSYLGDIRIVQEPVYRLRIGMPNLFKLRAQAMFTEIIKAGLTGPEKIELDHHPMYKVIRPGPEEEARHKALYLIRQGGAVLAVDRTAGGAMIRTGFCQAPPGAKARAGWLALKSLVNNYVRTGRGN